MSRLEIGINAEEKNLSAYLLAEKIRLHGGDFVDSLKREKLIKDGTFTQDESKAILVSGLVRWAQGGIERDFDDDNQWNVAVYETAASILEKRQLQRVREVKPLVAIKEVAPITILAATEASPLVSETVMSNSIEPEAVKAPKKKWYRAWPDSKKIFRRVVNTRAGRVFASLGTVLFLAVTTVAAKGSDVLPLHLADPFSGLPNRPVATLNAAEASTSKEVLEDLPSITFAEPDSYFAATKGRDDISSVKGKAEGFLAENVFGIQNFNPYNPKHMKQYQENFKQNPEMNQAKVEAMVTFIVNETNKRTFNAQGEPQSPVQGDLMRHFKVAGMAHGVDDKDPNNLVEYYVPKNIPAFFDITEHYQPN